MINLNKFYYKVFECVGVLLFFVILTFAISNYFKPFIIIFFFFILTKPIFNILTINFKINSKIAAFFSIVIINILLIIIISFLLSFAYNKFSYFIKYDMKIYLSAISSFFTQNKYLPKLGNIDINKFIENWGIINSEIITKSATYTLGSLLTYFISIITTYFLLVDGDKILASISTSLPKKIKDIAKINYRTVKNTIKIEILLVSISTLETIIGFSILGIKDAIILGLICSVLDLLPIIGVVVVFAPLIAYQFVSSSYIIAFGLVLLYILLQISRQIMETKLISTNLNLHPLLILISIYIGAELFGLLGIIIAPICLLTIREIIYY
ncbi:MAG TPA: AI-2E family transporter [Clostridiaceae bacterium]